MKYYAVSIGFLYRLIGGEIESQLGSLLLSIASNLAALSILTTYFGPWLLLDLHASAQLVADGFLFAGVLGAIAALIGGWLVDRFGRQTMIILSGLLQIIATIGLIFPVSGFMASLLFIVIRGAQSIRGVGQRALIADLSSQKKIVQTFAGFRLALHGGLLSGPIMGGLLLLGSWRLMLIGAMVLNLISFIGVRKTLLTHGTALAKLDSVTASTQEFWEILREGRFFLLFLAALSGWIVVYSYETVLPLQLIQAHIISPQMWGYILALGPVLVIFFQLRIGQWLVNIHMRARILIGSILMGVAFLLLLLYITPSILLFLTMIFISGDMVWGPTSDSIMVSVASERFRGLYMGMATMAMWLGSALAPIIDLNIQAKSNYRLECCNVTLLSAISAGLYILAQKNEPKKYQLKQKA